METRVVEPLAGL